MTTELTAVRQTKDILAMLQAANTNFLTLPCGHSATGLSGTFTGSVKRKCKQCKETYGAPVKAGVVQEWRKVG